jgi:hypothetical protein
MRDEEILEINPAMTVGHVNIPFSKVLAGEVTWGKA